MDLLSYPSPQSNSLRRLPVGTEYQKGGAFSHEGIFKTILKFLKQNTEVRHPTTSHTKSPRTKLLQEVLINQKETERLSRAKRCDISGISIQVQSDAIKLNR